MNVCIYIIYIYTFIQYTKLKTFQIFYRAWFLEFKANNNGQTIVVYINNYISGLVAVLTYCMICYEY